MQNSFFKFVTNIFYVHKRLVLICLLICFVMQSLTTGIVLCFGDDGHVELEVGLKGECCQTSKDAAQDPITFLLGEHDSNTCCGICNDIPLYITSEKKHNSNVRYSFKFSISLLPLVFSCGATGNESQRKVTFKYFSPSAFHISRMHTTILQV